jgi:hypothetical protein
MRADVQVATLRCEADREAAALLVRRDAVDALADEPERLDPGEHDITVRGEGDTVRAAARGARLEPPMVSGLGVETS